MKAIVEARPQQPAQPKRELGAPRRPRAERVHAIKAEAKKIRLWLPLPVSVLWALLAPFALLLSPLLYLAPRGYRLNGPEAAWRIGAVLFALSGTRIEIRSRDADILILVF
ncbi:hypothetical protein BH11PSE2_BH11PSE2_00500 [soil metagenome]